jgi:hypothetical protein
MAITLLKTFSAVVLILLAFLVFVLGGAILVEGRHFLDPYIDTEFAKDYTPEKFDQIRLGMTIEDAIQIIGEPLSKWRDHGGDLHTDYDYTTDGKLSEGDCAWYLSSLKVDSTHTIIDINTGWIYD